MFKLHIWNVSGTFTTNNLLISQYVVVYDHLFIATRSSRPNKRRWRIQWATDRYCGKWSVSQFYKHGTIVYSPSLWEMASLFHAVKRVYYNRTRVYRRRSLAPSSRKSIVPSLTCEPTVFDEGCLSSSIEFRVQEFEFRVQDFEFRVK